MFQLQKKLYNFINFLSILLVISEYNSEIIRSNHAKTILFRKEFFYYHSQFDFFSKNQVS